MAAAGVSCTKMKRRLPKSAEQVHQVTDEAEKAGISVCGNGFFDAKSWTFLEMERRRT